MSEIRLAPARSGILAIVVAIVAAFISGILVGPGISFEQAASATIVQGDGELTGTWIADDGGTYYVREVEGTVWWIGLDGTDGTRFSNVFHGKRAGDLITGVWSDVPRGKNLYNGALTIEVLHTQSGLVLRKGGSSGGFGAGIWTKLTATQQPRRVQAPGVEVKQKILDDGTVEIREPDGTVRKYHPDGSATITSPNGTTQRQMPMQTQVATPPLSLLAGNNLKPWLDAHNQGLLSIIQFLLPQEERDSSLRSLANAERGKSLYDQIDFRTGAIHRLRRR